MNRFNRQNPEIEQKTFKDYLNLLRINLLPILLITVTSLVFSIIYAVNAVNIYESTSTIKISKPPGNILESPLFPGMSDLGMDRFIANEIEVLKSYKVRQKVAEALIDSFKQVNSPKSFYLILDARTRKNEDTQPQLAETESIIQSLSSVEIAQKRGLDFVTISVESPSPFEAALIANVYTLAYRQVNLDFNRSQLTLVREFLTDQRKEKLNDLNEAEIMLQSFQEKGGIIALDQQASSLISQITTLESQRDMKKIELMAAEKQYAAMKKELDEKAPHIGAFLDKFASEQYLKSIQEQLAELKLQRELMNLNPKSYQATEAVKDYDKKIKVLEDLLAQKIEILKASIFATTPEELQSLTKGIIQQEITVQSLKIAIDQLNNLLKSYETKFSQLPKSSIELARLERNRESIQKLYVLVEEKYQEALINEQSQPGNVIIVDQARIPINPAKPNRVLIILVGLVVGVIIAFGYAFLKNYFDTTVKTPEDIQNYNTNVLAWIPQIEGVGSNGMNDFEFIVARKPDSIPAEAFRALRTRVQFSKVDTESLKTILVTSSAPSEGKTMICTNLAGTLALSNKRTLIIDCDLRKPRIHSFFKTNRFPGLVDHLFGQASLDEVIRTSEIHDLFYITAGTIPPNPSEILESQRMKEFLETVKDKFDYVLLDSPPVIAVTDSEILARLADATMLVVSANTTEIELMMRALEIIRQENVNFIGTVLNNFVYRSSYGSYYKYYYYYTRPKKSEKPKLPTSLNA